MRRGNRQAASPGMGCTEARLAISARVDGEQWRGDVSRLEHHLGRCPDCRAFEEACSGERPELVALARRLRLRSSRPVPQELLLQLSAVRDDSSRARRRARRPIRLPRRPLLSWVTAAAPVAAAAAVLPVALARPPAPAATHVPSPCTVALVASSGSTR